VEGETMKITRHALYEEIDELSQQLIANFIYIPGTNISREQELYLTFNSFNKIFLYPNFSRSLSIEAQVSRLKCRVTHSDHNESCTNSFKFILVKTTHKRLKCRELNCQCTDVSLVSILSL